MYCPGSQSALLGGFKHALRPTRLLKRFAKPGHCTEYLSVAGSQKHFTTFIPKGKFN